MAHKKIRLDEGKHPKSSFREEIALVIIILSCFILILLIVFGWLTSMGMFDNVKELFGMLLPLIGTWVGTVLAYYFSKQNYEAANQNVDKLVMHVTGTDEKLKGINVSEVMFKTDDFTYRSEVDENSFKSCKIKELIEFMTNKNIERLPILQKDKLIFIFLIYRTTLERFIIFVNQGNNQPMNTDSTVGDMFNSNFPLFWQIQTLTEKQFFLPVTATIAEASQKMRNNSICRDVFITERGNKDEKIMGWITDERIVEKSEIFKKT